METNNSNSSTTPSDTPSSSTNTNTNTNTNPSFLHLQTMFVPANNGASLVLTHFCETHGPSVVFTTQIISPFTHTLKPNTHSNSHTISSQQPQPQQQNPNDSLTSKVNVKFISEDLDENHSTLSEGQSNHTEQNPTVYVKSKHSYSSSQSTEVHTTPSTPRKNSRAIPPLNNNPQSASTNSTNTITSNNNPSDTTNTSTNNLVNDTNTTNITNLPNNMNSDTNTNNNGTPNSNNNNADTSITLLNNASPENITPVCPSCYSLNQGTGLVSPNIQHSNTLTKYQSFSYSTHPTIFYLSTPHPEPSSYSMIRTACVRGLSCELCPGREGPVVFGGPQEAFVVSYMFKITDSKARGSQRWYSFLFVQQDLSGIVSRIEWLTGVFQNLAREMQARANKLFKQERESSLYSPQQGSSSSLTIGIGFRRGVRGPVKSLRRLVDLMGDEDFFPKLHTSFCDILIKAQTIMSPIYYHFPLIDGRDYTQNSTFPFTYHDEIQFDTLQELFRQVGVQCMRVLIYNIIIGNQLVIRGNCRGLVTSALRILKDLIPESCVSVKYYEDIYCDTYVCNFLGLMGNVNFPDYLDWKTTALLDIQPVNPLPSALVSSASIDITEDVIVEDIKNIIDDIDSLIDIEASSSTNLIKNSDPDTTLTLQKIFPFSQSQRGNLTKGGTLDLLEIKKKRQQIMRDYTYTFRGDYQPTSLGQSIERVLESNFPASVEQSSMIRLKDEWLTKAKPFLKLRPMVQSLQDKKIAAFVKIMDINQETDLQVLSYWITGLKRPIAQFSRSHFT